MGLVDQAIEDRVGKGGVADAVVPVLEGELTGHEGGAAAVAVFEDFEQVAALAIGQRGEAPVIEDHEIGFGQGGEQLAVGAAGASVTAVDFSEGMLAEARGKPGSERVRFLACDLRRPLPFADGAFDLVVSGLVLEHIPDLDGFFGEARRVVRSGGRAVISAMHPAMFTRGAQARFTDPESGEIVRPGSVPHQVEDFVAAARRAGFGVESVAESAADAAFAVRYPRAARYVGWPMLVVMRLRAE